LNLYRTLFVASAAGLSLSAGCDSAVKPPEIGEVRGTTVFDSARSFQRQREESRHGKKVLAFGYCGSEQEGGLPWTCQELDMIEALVLGLAALLIAIPPLIQGLPVLISK
jgi:hypothetical protein